MANNLGSNPWVLDTPQPGVVIHPGFSFITNIIWNGYNNPADQCIIKGSVNPNGNPTLAMQLQGHGDLSDVTAGPAAGPLRIRDFILDTLSSGRVFVYLE